MSAAGLDVPVTVRRLIGTAFAAGIAVAFSFGAPTAGADGAGEAAVDSWSNFNWCPGDPIMQQDQPVNWDWSVCHDWHYMSPLTEGAPSMYVVVEGHRPSPCPPIAFMCP